MMHQKSSAVPAATGHDADTAEPSLEMKYSPITVTTARSPGKSSLAELFGRPMYDTTRFIQPEPLDDGETLRLLVVHLVQCASRERSSGMYWLDRWDPDKAFIRWIEGMCEETVCMVDLGLQRALFLEDLADAHPQLLRAFEIIRFEVYVVDDLATPSCPECGGAGQQWHRIEFESTTLEGSTQCKTCDGEGVLS